MRTPFTRNLGFVRTSFTIHPRKGGPITQAGMQGYLGHTKHPPPLAILGGGARFLMSEVPLYSWSIPEEGGPAIPEAGLQGYLAHKKTPPNPRTTIGP